MDPLLLTYLTDTFSILAPAGDQSLKTLLSNRINDLILHDFNKLVMLLYRIDVSEKKLTALLKENNATDAADIIATLVIERQEEKIKSRQESRRDNNFNEEEKW